MSLIMNTAPPSKPHFNYIDCIRGYAVILVITSHYTYLFPNLPYPVHRLAVMGWFGVQLFFITSCLTLMMSWQYEEKTKGKSDIFSFFIRRFFRIAPAYYIAAVVYFFTSPPKNGFDIVQAVSTVTFVNAWHPLLLPTVIGRWTVVPGGWSIGVEFTFYMIFPIFARSVRSLSSAVLMFFATIISGVFLNRLAFGFFVAKYSAVSVGNFLFFWFPNEACVFVFGAMIFFLLDAPASGVASSTRSNILAIVAAIGFFSLGFVNLGKFLGAEPIVPAFLAVCVPLSIFVFAISGVDSGFFVNRYIAQIGKVSFSAYLFHFAVLRVMEATLPARWLDLSGFQAIGAFVMVWPVAVLLSFAIAWISYHLLEQPGMAIGKDLIRRLKYRAA